MRGHRALNWRGSASQDDDRLQVPVDHTTLEAIDHLAGDITLVVAPDGLRAGANSLTLVKANCVIPITDSPKHQR